MTRPKITRRDLLKATAFGVLGVIVTLSTGDARAQGNGTKIEGSWTASTQLLTGPGAPGRFRAMYTFMAGGGLVETDQSERTPPLLGPGHGVWKRVGTHDFRFKVVKFAFDGKGQPMGTTRVTGVATFTGAGTYSSTGTYAFYSTSGHAMGGGRFRETATRISLG